MKVILGAFMFLVVIFSSCKETKPSATRLAEHNEMINFLDSIANQGQALDYYHWNAERAEEVKSLLKTSNPSDTLSLWFNYVQELLRSGQTTKCISAIEHYINSNGETPSVSNKALFEVLAIAHLRLGEEENCQKNHSRLSCIVPIKGSGIHRFPAGSRRALELYRALEKAFHEDRYKWLINLASMTLDEYPEKLSEMERLKLPENDTFQFNSHRFRDIAEDVNTNINGLSGGVCVDDFNDDGRLDVFTTAYGMQENVRLLIQDKNGAFVDATDSSNLRGIVSGLNCIHADYDNDGDKDIFITRGGWLGSAGTHPNSLLQNQGDGSFIDVTKSAGLLSFHPTQTASWADFDLDGNLDLFVGNESVSGSDNPCELYRNNGDGTFTEVSSNVGIGALTAWVKGVVWGDLDNDGWPDLFVSVLGGKNYLFKNNEGSFENIAERAGVEFPHYGFSCWIADVNNDGFEDLYVGSYDLRFLSDVAGEFVREISGKEMLSEPLSLYINQGNGTFVNKSEQFGIQKPLFGMGINYGDINNDGLLDFYVGTGSPEFNSIVPNRMFLNLNGSAFNDATFIAGFGHIQKGHGIAFADIDNDGDQDIYAVQGGAYEGDNFTNVLFENSITGSNWVSLILEGTESNKSAIGARVRLTLSNGDILHRTVSTGGSFGGSPLRVEVGLGNAKSVESLAITWPSKSKSSFSRLPTNQILKIVEGNDNVIQN